MGTHGQVYRNFRTTLSSVFHNIIKMKLLFVAALLCMVAFNVDALKRCSSNDDCGTDGCCYGIGNLMWCHEFSHEGEWCSITSRYGCGCEPGLLCKREGLWETCQTNSTMAY